MKKQISINEFICEKYKNRESEDDYNKRLDITKPIAEKIYNNIISDPIFLGLLKISEKIRIKKP